MNSRHAFALLAAVALLPGCAAEAPPLGEVEVGQSRAQVEATVGAPDTTQTFALPEPPFWGPQEGLTVRLQPGDPVEEWRYRVDEDITYVWFTPDPADPDADWTVIDLATYPADADF